MKVLSIDVGIKNLAFCLLDVENESNFTILKWDCISVCEEKKNNCIICEKPAKYFKNQTYYCKKHANKDENLAIPNQSCNFQQIKKLKFSELYLYADDNKIDYIKPIKKDELLKKIEEHINKTYFNIIKPQRAEDVDLVSIGKILKTKFDDIFSCDFINLDTVLIENQISPLANRMKTLQGMLTQYFIMKTNSKIIFVSSANKLKEYNNEKGNEKGNDKTTYNERKKIGIEYCQKIIVNNPNLVKWTDLFNKHSKKDDLADSFLQAVWYIKSQNK